MATKTFTLLLTPADVSLFREPRPFQPGDTSLVSTLPNPQATAGAIRTWLLEALGVDLTRLKRDKPIEEAITALCPAAEWIVNARLRGPLLCRNGGVLLPSPQHLLGEEDGDDFKPLGFMRPSLGGVPGASHPQGAPDGFKPAWFSTDGNGEPITCYLDVEAITQVMAGKKPKAKEFIKPRDCFDIERRLGIGMNSDKNTREETLLYSAGFLRLDEKQAICFRVDIEIDAAKETEFRDIGKRCPWLLWGGEKRAASVEIVASPLPLPCAPELWNQSEEMLFTTYLSTPALFEGGKWLPQRLMKDFELVSAVVGSPLAWSAWSRVTNQPRPTRYAVKTGAVYFWRKPKDVIAEDPHGSCISDEPADAQAGWGLCLRGVWNYAE